MSIFQIIELLNNICYNIIGDNMKKITLILVLLLSLITLVGCTTKKKSDPLQEILDKNNYIIVDVRTKEEYDVSHVKGSINIPYDQIDENTNLDKSKTIIVYCRSGNRSSKAYNNLKSLGYDVYDLGAFDKITLEKE